MAFDLLGVVHTVAPAPLPALVQVCVEGLLVTNNPSTAKPSLTAYLRRLLSPGIVNFLLTHPFQEVDKPLSMHEPARPLEAHIVINIIFGITSFFASLKPLYPVHAHIMVFGRARIAKVMIIPAWPGFVYSPSLTIERIPAWNYDPVLLAVGGHLNIEALVEHTVGIAFHYVLATGNVHSRVNVVP